MTPTPSPGSDAALDLGCRCPVLDNSHGRGIPGTESLSDGPYFYMNEGCPVHWQAGEEAPSVAPV